MAALVKRIFDIERHELPRALLMFLYAFLLLSAYLILKPVRNSLFINRFGADQLVFMYMIIAVTAAPIASLYGWTASRTTLPRLVGGTTLVIVLSLALFWYLTTLKVSWLVYVFYVWVSLFGVFTTSQFWLLANYVFDARESKRIFPFIAAGAITGGIMGSLITGMLAELVGTENLLWLCIVFMLACFGILLKVWPMRHGDDQSRTSQKKKSRDIKGMLPVILKSRHLRLLALMISLTVMVSTFVDFQFNKVVGEAFDTKDELTAFFGSFFFWLSLTSLALQLMLSSRVLRRFGIGAAILCLPVGLMLGSAAIFLFPVLASAIFVKISDGSLRYSINKTGLELLYLPVPAAIKGRVKAMLDVVGDRFARGIGGGMLYVVIDLLRWPVQWISFLSGGLIAAWIAVAVMIKREYSETFRTALAMRTIDSEDVMVQLQDAISIDALAGTVKSGDTRQILFALELTEGLHDTRLAEPLSGLLANESAEIRLQAIRQLMPVGDGGFSDRVRPLLSDADGDVRCEAIKYLSTRSSEEGLKLLEEFLHSSDPMLRASACRCAVGPDLAAKAQQLITPEILKDIMTNQTEQGTMAREQLAVALGLAGPDNPVAGCLPQLLVDDDPKVRRHAILGAAHMKKPEYLPVIIGYLADAHLRGLAAKALQEYGPSILGTLRDYILNDYEPIIVRLRLPRIIALIGTREAADILVAQLSNNNALLRYQVIRGLNIVRRRGDDLRVERAGVQDHMTEEAKNYYTICGYYEALQSAGMDSPASMLLMQALEDRQRLFLEQAFRLAGLIYPLSDMFYAYNGVTSSAGQVRARAIEFLDTVWERQHKKHLFPILERTVQLSEAGRQLFKLPRFSTREVLREILIGNDAWLATCAAFVVSEGKLGEYREEVRALRDSSHEALRETAEAALKAIDTA